MKILHVISGLSNGGAEGVLYRLIESDNKNLHEIVSLTDGGIYFDKFLEIDIAVTILNMPRGGVTVHGISQLYQVIKASSADVVHTWMYHSDLLGGVLARFSGIKNIIWGIRGPYNRERTSFSTKLIVYSCMLLSRWVPKLITSNSHYAKGEHIKIGYSLNKFKVIPNGYKLDYAAFSEQEKTDFYKKHQIKQDSLLLGMVSRFDPHKDHNNLFLALKILQSRGLNFICLLVGSGMDEENGELLSLLNRYNLSGDVRLLGRSDSVPEIMSLLDVHILSSAAESFPNVLAEAMVMGTPCVSTDVGDATDIIKDTGWIVPAENPSQLADAVIDASEEMKDGLLWRKRQLMCRKRIEENYSLEQMISAYHDIWNEVANE